MRQAIVPEEFPFLDPSRYTFALGIDAGGYAWISGHTGVQYDAERDDMVLGSTLEQQMRVAYAKALTILEAADLGPDSIVRVVEYVPAEHLSEHRSAADEVRRSLVEADPVVVVVPVDRLLRPEARIEVEVLAGRPGSPNSLSYLTVAGEDAVAQAERGLSTAGRSWPHVLRALGVGIAPNGLWPATLTPPAIMLGLAGAGGPATPLVDLVVGQGPVEPVALDGRMVGATAGGISYLSACTGPSEDEDLEVELRANYAAITRAVEAAGATLDDVVKTVEFITPGAIAGYRATARVRRELFAEPFPAATGVIVPELPRDARVLVEAIVVRGG